MLVSKIQSKKWMENYRVYGEIAVITLTGFFLSRTGIKESIYPFGQAYLMVALSYALYPVFALAGCLLGYLTLYPNVPWIAVTVCAGCFFTLLMVERVKKVERKKFLPFCYLVYTALGIGLLQTKLRYFLLLSVIEAAIGFFSMFIFDKAANLLYVGKKRSMLTDDEILCLVFCLCALVIACGNQAIFGLGIGMVLAVFITILVGYLCGGAFGAVSGLIMGLCVNLGGGSIYVVGNMGVCGFAAGACKKLGRPACALGFFAANYLLTFYMNGNSIVILPYQNILAAGVLVIALPPKQVERIAEFFHGALQKSKQESYYIGKYNTLAKSKMDNLSQLFAQMSELFSDNRYLKTQGELDMGKLVQSVVDHSCKDCPSYQRCWQEHFFDSYAQVEEMLLCYNETGSVGRNRMKCMDKGRVEKQVFRALKAVQDSHQWENKIEESKELVSKQLMGISHVLSGLSADIDQDVQFEKEMEREILEDLQLKGVYVTDVCVQNLGGYLKAELTVKSCGGRRSCKQLMEKCVSRHCGRVMLLKTPCTFGQQKQCTLVFQQAKALHAVTHIAQVAKGDVCGDSFKTSRVSDREYMMVLSDGMGSGRKAKEESSACVSLLENFYQAGFDDEIIFQTINKLMVLKNQEEMFTTVDLCMVDLASKRARFTKIGAVPSYIFKPGGGVNIVHGNSLPLGILDDVETQVFIRDLEEGDMIIMFTDGIFDRLGGMENIQRIDGLLADIIGGRRDGKEIAGAIIDYCLKVETDMEQDDMTVLISMFKKPQVG